jgi:hypothetical protein
VFTGSDHRDSRVTFGGGSAAHKKSWFIHQLPLFIL